ncbi:flavodoxin [Lachnoclostridium sp. An118]|uniref:flavodoxin n=1 Tax=Lachnoclostridium sp. An118 TaxID=1965547 RepID=UPI000B390314|nr:flavodoxin [Lachnoclostridium sp. An118]OUQ49113.1 flavodoxin [Lachnoclostridium sp. An118]
MKTRLLSLLIAGVMTAGLLSGCGASEDTQDQSDSTAQSDQSADETSSDTEANTENTSDGVASDGKTLVVYYSATGNTEAVANYIADATGGDLFELEPIEPYTDEDLNYNDENSRVSQEYADESLRDVELVSATVEGFDEYENIFVGYPIWWQVAAWPVNQFIENNDFTGKTVIPFCTSASSGIGDSGQLLEEMAGTGNWLEGVRFRSSASEEDVVVWVDSLGL